MEDVEDISRAVECQWMTGEIEPLQAKCATVGDIRMQLCAMKKCIWHELVLLTEDASVLLDDDLGAAPSRVRVVVQRAIVGEETWVDTLISHVTFDDVAGLKTALPRMQNEVADATSIIRQLWFSGLGRCEHVQTMIDADIDVNTQSHYGRSLLHKACERGLIDLGELLIRADADVEGTFDAFGFSPLHDAAYYGHYAMCEAVLKARALVDVTDSSEYTPLHYAALKNDKVDVVELLVSYGANVDMPAPSGLSALHMAINHGNAKVTQWLIMHGADTNYADMNGLSVLHLASKLGLHSTASMLIQHKALVDAQTKHGDTPLQFAVRQADKEMIEILLAASDNQDVNLKLSTTAGLTALDLARTLKRHSIAEMLSPLMKT